MIASELGKYSFDPSQIVDYPREGNSPHSLVIGSSLLQWVSTQGIFAQGFADDGVALIAGKILSTICEIMQRILHGIEKWSNDEGLSVNPEKMEPDKLLPITLYGQELVQTDQVKYLGVILDPKLNWKQHVDAKCSKALTSFYQVRRSVWKTWGLTPRVIK